MANITIRKCLCQELINLDNEKFQEFIADQFTKLFSEFQGMKSDVSGLKQDVSELKQDVSELKSDVAIIKVDLVALKDSQIRLESEFHNQIAALHDFRIEQTKANLETENELITLSTQLGKLQMETAHLRIVK